MSGAGDHGLAPSVWKFEEELQMNELVLRLLEPGDPPTRIQVESLLGKSAFKYWQQIIDLIEKNYPGVFAPEWLYGGKKHGWSLRYKKSKSFCTLIPEKNSCKLLIVFGAKVRAGVETIRHELSAPVRQGYDQATTYHDGKWFFFKVDSKSVVNDVEKLLAIKRKPKKPD
jgi:hypothetical protein